MGVSTYFICEYMDHIEVFEINGYDSYMIK